MKCYECKNCKNSKSKIYMGFCKKYKLHVLDNYNGCLNGNKK